MKTTIWASCPKCQTELKIDTDETELVQIECPDCHKVFAAKVPARTAAPVHEVFSQMPVLPPFQPAQVHYKPRKKSDDSLSPAALTALIVVCASAILIPLGLGGYYLYGSLSETSPTLTMSSTPPSTTATTSNVQANVSAAPSNETTETASSFKDLSAPMPTGRKIPPSSDSVDNNESTPKTESNPFGVPELNPPPLIQPEAPSPQVTQTPTSPPTTTAPMTNGPMANSPMTTHPMSPNPGAPGTNTPTPSIGNGNSSQVQVSVSGPGTSQSGLPVSFHRFVGPTGVFIFVLHPKGHSVTSSVQDLQRTLSVAEMHAEGGSDYTAIGIRYSGPVDTVAKGIRFGKVSYVDEESRSIHVQAN